MKTGIAKRLRNARSERLLEKCGRLWDMSLCQRSRRKSNSAWLSKSNRVCWIARCRRSILASSKRWQANQMIAAFWRSKHSRHRHWANHPCLSWIIPQGSRPTQPGQSKGATRIRGWRSCLGRQECPYLSLRWARRLRIATQARRRMSHSGYHLVWLTSKVLKT